MAAGIKVFREDGSLLFDVGSRLYRRIARISYTNTNGSAVFGGRQPEDTNLVAVPRGWYAPSFTVNPANNTVSWDFGSIRAQDRFGGVVEIWAS